MMNTKTLAAAVGLLLLTAAAHAQDGGFGPPPPQGGFGGRGGGFGGGGRGFGPPPPASAATVPADALASALSLSADQTAKITQIQNTFQKARQALRPARGMDGPPDPSTMQANQTKMKALDTQASADVTNVLTSAQKKALPALLTQMDTMRQVGIPAELMGSLKLTDAQKSKLADVAKAAQAAGPGGRRQAHDAAQAVLTDAQKAQIAAWQDAHPRPQFGPGGGGRGVAADVLAAHPRWTAWVAHPRMGVRAARRPRMAETARPRPVCSGTQHGEVTKRRSAQPRAGRRFVRG